MRKAASWGHSRERDWPELIEEAFQGKGKNLFGTDLHFRQIENPYFDPFAVEIPKGEVGQTHFPNVKKVDPRAIFKMGLIHDGLL